MHPGYMPVEAQQAIAYQNYMAAQQQQQQQQQQQRGGGYPGMPPQPGMPQQHSHQA
jgi:MADS-box transcription factor